MRSFNLRHTPPMSAPFRLSEIFIPNARANLAGLVAVVDPDFGPLTATRTGFTRPDGTTIADQEVLDHILMIYFDATESMRAHFLNLLFGKVNHTP